MTAHDPSAAVFATFPQLETERLILRQITMADRAAIFRIYSDPDVTRYNVVEQFQHIADAERLIAEIQAQFSQRLGLRWGITLRDRGTVIGSCILYHWHRSGFYAHCCTLGFDLARVYWGHGYASESLQAVLRFGFETMGLNRIETNIMPENEAAIRFLKKHGFRIEGVMREKGYWKNQFHDVQHLALLKHEWQALNPPRE
jgi:ribosomal-protein-alanine N-acetyltransferase